MRARYYDPGVGRFEGEDPAWSGSNWFIYADNSPTNRLDRSGKTSEAVASAENAGLEGLGTLMIEMGLEMMGSGAGEITSGRMIMNAGKEVQAVGTGIMDATFLGMLIGGSIRNIGARMEIVGGADVQGGVAEVIAGAMMTMMGSMYVAVGAQAGEMGLAPYG